ncbi:CaiB/BaiF CoA transferase family protein [Sphingomonas flavalba]|uniref:CaiB/BaiF CoA transferase family protein n=1 Tax=Sphingomonas flavalba TaxID=2559804 RepID=UPI00109D9BC2|nr:CaiB/BaiF CoA-transferase family protein [Sphingomonas flavalba]
MTEAHNTDALPAPARGPLHGLRIIEVAGIGPGPFCAMMLADHGSEVIRVAPPGAADGASAAAHRLLLHRRPTLTVNLKVPAGRALLLRLATGVDGLIEGFRPGAMERLGLGPDALLAANPALVYGRMTGWGQDGPRAGEAGHDINYIALAGALGRFGPPDGKPALPANLLGDFAGGGLLLAFGMLAAFHAVRGGAPGQVVDCAMTEGASLLMTMLWSLRAAGLWTDRRGANLLDGGAPFYDSYATADGGHVAVGAIEPAFYAALLAGLGCADDPDCARRDDPAAWPLLKRKFAAIFATRSRAEWEAVFAGTDACVTPVLTMAEAAHDPHFAARAAFIDAGGIARPAPAPRYSGFPLTPAPAADRAALLASFGIDEAEQHTLIAAGVFAP